MGVHGVRWRRSRPQTNPEPERPAAGRAAPLKLVCAGAAAALAMSPVAAIAAGGPSPSPALNAVLAAPPAGDFTEESQGTSLEGDFDVGGYVDFLTTANAATTRKTLEADGFVGGFGRSWISKTANHLMLEAAIAFKGAAGAKRWLSTAKSSDESDQFYKGSISVSGIESYYGVHFADPTTPAYADVVSFVKGNDYFIVGFVSAANDLADNASTQTRRQYDAAPAYTIPPSRWPESAEGGLARVAGSLPPAAYAAAGAALLLVLLALVAVAVWAARRMRARPRPAPAPLLMSGDGRYWWDGRAWRDVERDVPPGVLTSDDGRYWWDGAVWRPVGRSRALGPEAG